MITISSASIKTDATHANPQCSVRNRPISLNLGTKSLRFKKAAAMITTARITAHISDRSESGRHFSMIGTHTSSKVR